MKGNSPFLPCLLITLLLGCFAESAVSQIIPAIRFDSTFRKSGSGYFDSSKKVLLSTFRKPGIDSTLFDIDNPFRKLLKPSGVVQLQDAFVSYDFNYRSSIDTPYVEKDLAQHNVLTRINLVVAGMLPLMVTYRGRQSNSTFFRDLHDVQVSFNGDAFRQQLQSALQQRLLAMASGLKDSLTEKLYLLKYQELLNQKKWLENPFQIQKLIEARQVLTVPKITWDYSLPDSANQRRADSLQKVAGAFIALYDSTQQIIKQLNHTVDSLKKKYDSTLVTVNRYRKMASSLGQAPRSYQPWKDKGGNTDAPAVELPAKYRWLMGIRNFSVGRSTVDYSELSAKNINITGLNFEYNSWYYLALTAGTVDYRFRDFAINRFKRTPQYFYMIRAGIGRLEGNHVILSAFKGRKQLFAGNGNTQGVTAIDLWGVGIAARMQVTRNTWVSAEVAESLSPDYRTIPVTTSTKFSLSDNTNKAVAFKVFSWLPHLKLRLEGMYKYTGANFQSFSSFQTNAVQKNWFIKADKQFFRNQLRINASVRSNEFSNPYIVQDYRNNNIFMSLTTTLRIRKWPVVSVGYLPMSQLTVLDDQTIESRFQTLNASAFHSYKIKGLRMSSTVLYNRFYNTNNDSGYAYYKAINIYGAQSFFFPWFTMNTAYSRTSNSSYVLNVMEGGATLPVKSWGSIGFGVRINNYNSTLNKTGGYLNASICITSQDILYLSYENNYLPGYYTGLTRNVFANIQFNKTFRFR